jgi:hypothetical protein
MRFSIGDSFLRWRVLTLFTAPLWQFWHLNAKNANKYFSQRKNWIIPKLLDMFWKNIIRFKDLLLIIKEIILLLPHCCNLSLKCKI